jgi:hypothetical protein
MLKLGRDADLAQKALRAERLRQIAPEDFDRDLAVVLEVFGELHCRHPARTELPLHTVVLGEGDGRGVRLGGPARIACHGSEDDELPCFRPPLSSSRAASGSNILKTKKAHNSTSNPMARKATSLNEPGFLWNGRSGGHQEPTPSSRPQQTLVRARCAGRPPR